MIPSRDESPEVFEPLEAFEGWVHTPWAARGACRGHTDLFFAPHAERPQARVRRERRAGLVCQRCPVLLDCRRYARRLREYGFCGGESEEQRARAGYPVPSPVGGRTRRTAAG